MTKELKEIVHNFLAVYEQANALPIISPMSNGQSTYLLSIAVDILRHLEQTNEHTG
jgi:hypothetical protein